MSLEDVGRLLISCPDRPGIVAAVSHFLFERGANIIRVNEHSSERGGGTFFMRLEFRLEGLEDRLAPGRPLPNGETRRIAAEIAAGLAHAHARGLVGYWRTPGFLRGAEGHTAAGLGHDERFVALLHLGHARQEKEPPGRAPAGDYVTYLP